MTSLRSVSDLDRLTIGDLSDWFNPFLEHFVRETVRSGGEVFLAIEGPVVQGIYLHDEAEGSASVFTRLPAVANAFYRLREGVGVYSEIPLGAPHENYDIFSRELTPDQPVPEFRHTVRGARPDDRSAIVELMTEVYGRFNPRWLDPWPPRSEKGYVVDVGGRVAGTAWLSTVAVHGRLHSLTVGPRFRRLGIGTDLLRARLMSARRSGVLRVVSEIPEHNAASRAIAAGEEMRPVGVLFRYDRR
jgi:ribosomal protein S18 acetylase RimI-like enzyme